MDFYIYYKTSCCLFPPRFDLWYTFNFFLTARFTQLRTRHYTVLVTTKKHTELDHWLMDFLYFPNICWKIRASWVLEIWQTFGFTEVALPSDKGFYFTNVYFTQ